MFVRSQVICLLKGRDVRSVQRLIKRTLKSRLRVPIVGYDSFIKKQDVRSVIVIFDSRSSGDHTTKLHRTIINEQDKCSKVLLVSTVLVKPTLGVK
jgi:hypothetical protein